MFVHSTDEEAEVKEGLTICSRLLQQSWDLNPSPWTCISFTIGGLSIDSSSGLKSCHFINQLDDSYMSSSLLWSQLSNL